MSSTTSPAIAKAKLLTSSLNAAAELKLSTTAVAVLAHLISDSWPQDDGWTAHTPQATIASKLDISTQTVRRALADLSSIVDHQPGQGNRRSRYVFRSVPTPVSALPITGEQRSHHRCRDGPYTGGGTLQVSGSLQQQQHAPTLPSVRSTDAPAAAAISIELKPDVVQERIEFLRRRPDWLPEKKPWILPDVVRELALRPELTSQVVNQTLREARDSRHTLDNPAGWIVSRLRKHAQEPRP